MRLPVFALLRWIQRHPKAMRIFDLSFGLLSLGMALWQGSLLWMMVSVVFILAGIFRLGERMNLFLPKLKLPEQDKDA
jgi:hypothetical protein